jgi:Calcineurin-like phosphoesterase/Fibronectin type III domain
MYRRLALTQVIVRQLRNVTGLLFLVSLLATVAPAQHPRASVRAVAQDTSSVTFAAIGDYGSNDANEQDVANLVKSWNPDFIISLGDNNYPDGEAATIDANVGKYYQEYIGSYKGSYGPGATTNRFWPCVGNRDWENLTGAKLQPYLDYFTLPNNERYYDFVQGPVHFFVLDSDSREPDGVTSTSKQALWLKSRLAASTAPWKIVYLHHPPFSSRTPFTNLQWPFREWGANIVLSGHAHLYERIMKNGFPYIINGLGGESLGSFATATEGSLVRFGSDFGALRITAGSTTLSLEFITRKGVLVDSYTISRNVPTLNAPTSLSASVVSTDRIDLTWTDNSEGEDGFKVEQSTDGLSFSQVATVGPNVNSYANTGLQAATTYYYRVRAFTYDRDSGYSNLASATTTMGIPAGPTLLSASAGGSSQINLTWTDNATNESGFQIQRCAGAGCTNFQEIAETAANINAYSNTGLAANTTYRYRVRAFNDSGDSSFTNVAEAKTASNSALPAAPSALTATAVSSTQINLTWTDNSNNEDGFKLYRSTDGVNFSTTATLGPNVTSYSNTGRSASTTYYYRVKAINAQGNSAYSNIAGATTFAPATVNPSAPDDLTATAVSGTQINLTWSDNSNNEDGFKLYRSTDGVNFTQISKPAANVTAYADTSCVPATTYYYRIRAYNAKGNSGYSNTAQARTP